MSMLDLHRLLDTPIHTLVAQRSPMQAMMVKGLFGNKTLREGLQSPQLSGMITGNADFQRELGGQLQKWGITQDQFNKAIVAQPPSQQTRQAPAPAQAPAAQPQQAPAPVQQAPAPVQQAPAQAQPAPASAQQAPTTGQVAAATTKPEAAWPPGSKLAQSPVGKLWANEGTKAVQGLPTAAPVAAAAPRPQGAVFSSPGIEIRPVFKEGQVFGRTATAGAQPFNSIVSHWTGEPDLRTSIGHLYGDPKRGGQSFGYHFYIDRDGSIYQGAPLDARTNHVGGPDRTSSHPHIRNESAIGISMVGQGNPTPQQLAAGQKLATALQGQYSIKPENIVSHGEITGRSHGRHGNEGAALVNAVRGQQPAAQPTTLKQAVAQAAPSGPDAMGRWKQAIAGIESGGRYNALGPITKTGDRAYGKYQIMGDNIPKWSREALGQTLTPQQFLASPEAQERIFEHRFQGYVDKYGEAGASRAWFAGERGMHRPGATDQLGTSVASYQRKFEAGGGVTGRGPQQGQVAAYAPQASVAQAPAQQAIASAIKQPGGAEIASASPAARESLGQRIIAGMGPAGAALTTFTDPATGIEYLTGSMGGTDVFRPIDRARKGIGQAAVDATKPTAYAPATQPAHQQAPQLSPQSFDEAGFMPQRGQEQRFRPMPQQLDAMTPQPRPRPPGAPASVFAPSPEGGSPAGDRGGLMGGSPYAPLPDLPPPPQAGIPDALRTSVMAMPDFTTPGPSFTSPTASAPDLGGAAGAASPFSPAMTAQLPTPTIDLPPPMWAGMGGFGSGWGSGGFAVPWAQPFDFGGGGGWGGFGGGTGFNSFGAGFSFGGM
jgi:hypothetical protein